MEYITLSLVFIALLNLFLVIMFIKLRSDVKNIEKIFVPFQSDSMTGKHLPSFVNDSISGSYLFEKPRSTVILFLGYECIECQKHFKQLNNVYNTLQSGNVNLSVAINGKIELIRDLYTRENWQFLVFLPSDSENDIWKVCNPKQLTPFLMIVDNDIVTTYQPTTDSFWENPLGVLKNVSK